jgi:hypothetical protein
MTGSFQNIVDRLKKKDDDILETTLAIRIKNLSWLGSFAYLHTIFKPLLDSTLVRLEEQETMPASVRQFYRSCNGMELYAGTIRMFGFVARGTPLDRSDPFSLPPLSITQMNRNFIDQRYAGKLLCIGAYSYDRSLLCVDHASGRIICYQGEDLNNIRKTWPTIDDWMISELARLSMLFSPDGRVLVDRRLCLPDASESQSN